MYEDIKKIKTGDFVYHDNTRRPRIRREPSHRKKPSSKPLFLNSLLVRCGVCAVLLAAVLLVVYGNFPITNRMKSGLVGALTFEIDVDKSLGKLKFVQSNNSTVQSVMSSSFVPSMELPVKKAVTVSAYHEDSKSMILEATELTDIVSPSAGIVENVDNNREFAVTIDHGNDIKSVITFNGAMAVIKEGSVLKKGDYIGIMDKGETLTFNVIKNGQNVNPADYLEK